MTEHKQVSLSINGAQSVRLEKGTIAFKNYFKQIPVPFKNYANFECNLKGVESYERFCSKKYQDYMPCSFAYKLCIDDKFRKYEMLFLEVKMLLMNLLKQLLRSANTAEK